MLIRSSCCNVRITRPSKIVYSPIQSVTSKKSSYRSMSHQSAQLRHTGVNRPPPSQLLVNADFGKVSPCYHLKTMNCKVLSLIYTHTTFNRESFYTRMYTTCTCALIAREKTKTMCIPLRLVELFNTGFMVKAGHLPLKIEAPFKICGLSWANCAT